MALDPTYYFVRYLLWKRVPPKAKPSIARKDRLLAANALEALRLFPAFAATWLTDADNIDSVVREEGLDHEALTAEDEEDDEAENDFGFVPPPGTDDPESLWELQKKNYGMVSDAMDKLMGLTGLKEVKKAAIGLAMEMLLEPPAYLVSTTSYNLLFLGNPGCGKTTVAKLLAQAMVDLKFRTNPDPVLTDASEILGASGQGGPAAEFASLCKKAEGGTMFIDEGQ
jgi:hypothetical protein